MNVYMDVLEQQFVLGSMRPLLYSLPRSLPLRDQFHWHDITSRQYKHLNSNLTRINEMYFRFQTEKNQGFTTLTKVSLTLHFIIE